MTPEELKRLFDNNSDCYADSHEVIPAMTRERFVEIVSKLMGVVQDTTEPEMAIPSFPHNCVDPLFDIIGCNMPKGSCSSCAVKVVPPDEWNPASEPPDTDRDVLVKLSDGREYEGCYLHGGKGWHIYYHPNKMIVRSLRHGETVQNWKEID